MRLVGVLTCGLFALAAQPATLSAQTSAKTVAASSEPSTRQPPTAKRPRGLAARRAAATRALNLASPAYQVAQNTPLPLPIPPLSGPAALPAGQDSGDMGLSLDLGQTSRTVQPTEEAGPALTTGAPGPLTEGRWYLFAAARGRSVGLNFLSDSDGEPYNNWTSERLPSVGDIQVGLGWRYGPHQTSIGYVVRRHRYHDAFLDQIAPHRDEMIAVSYTIRPEPPERKILGPVSQAE